MVERSKKHGKNYKIILTYYLNLFCIFAEVIIQKSNIMISPIESFKNDLASKYEIDKLSDYYKRGRVDVLRELDKSIRIFRRRDKSIKKISINYKDHRSGIAVKHVRNF